MCDQQPGCGLLKQPIQGAGIRTVGQGVMKCFCLQPQGTGELPEGFELAMFETDDPPEPPPPRPPVPKKPKKTSMGSLQAGSLGGTSRASSLGDGGWESLMRGGVQGSASRLVQGGSSALDNGPSKVCFFHAAYGLHLLPYRSSVEQDMLGR